MSSLIATGRERTRSRASKTRANPPRPNLAHHLEAPRDDHAWYELDHRRGFRVHRRTSHLAKQRLEGRGLRGIGGDQVCHGADVLVATTGVMGDCADILDGPRLSSTSRAMPRLVGWLRGEPRVEDSAAARGKRPVVGRHRDHAGYGPAVLAYLVALARDQDRADDVFSQFCEDLWQGLPGFRRDASVRTWVYTLAWHAWLRRRAGPLSPPRPPSRHGEMSRLAAEVRLTTARHLNPRRRTRSRGCASSWPRRAVPPGPADRLPPVVVGGGDGDVHAARNP